MRGAICAPDSTASSALAPWKELDPRVELQHVETLDERHVPDADVLVATFWPTASVAQRLAGHRGQPCYLIQHYEEWAGTKDDVDASWRAPMPKIFVSKWLRDRALDIGLEDHGVHHAPNAIDHEVFRTTTPIEGRDKHVAMLYSQAEWKGAADGLAALESARRRVTPIYGRRCTAYGRLPKASRTGSTTYAVRSRTSSPKRS